MSVFDDMLNFIKSAWKARSYIVPCLVGPPGIGKTAACLEAAEQLKDQGATGKVVTIIASQILPNEVSGITMPVPERHAMEIYDHYRLSSLVDGDILFFDELLEADQMVLSACLTLIESRQLMSGAKLPDIMIVAATNTTIKSQMLKLSIRQRFLWRQFEVDTKGTQQYIKDNLGVSLSNILVSKLASDGKDYNVLTPRSLTKMVKWICEAESLEEAEQIADHINRAWDSMLGTEIKNLWAKKFSGPEYELRQKIKEIVVEAYGCEDLDLNDPIGRIAYEKGYVEEASMSDLLEILQSLPEWDKISSCLAAIEIDES